MRRPLLVAAGVNALVALAAWAARTVSASRSTGRRGAGHGRDAGDRLSGWLLLDATFAAAVVASRMGLRRKTLLGIAENAAGAVAPATPSRIQV